jgi:hypothetical protein
MAFSSLVLACSFVFFFFLSFRDRIFSFFYEDVDDKEDEVEF